MRIGWTDTTQHTPRRGVRWSAGRAPERLGSGNAGEEEIDEYLYSSLLLPPFERDMLAIAVNEYISDLQPGPRAPYSAGRP